MSMENGWELDFPGDDDNAMRYGSRAEIPGTAGDIPEPDFASIDEMPRVITKVENMELVLTDGVDCEFGCMPMDHGELNGLTVDVSQPHGRSYHLSFARTSAFGTSTETVRLRNERELREAFHAIGAYLGEWVE